LKLLQLTRCFIHMAVLPHLMFAALVDQTNGNWKAFVFSSDAAMLARLPTLIGGDVRFTVLKDLLESKSATEQAVDLVLQRKECKWVSVTSGDAVYGSEVVERALNAEHKFNTSSTERQQQPSSTQADIILAPLDSKSFADKGENFSFMYGCNI
jgi:hypothetical protein